MDAAERRKARDAMARNVTSALRPRGFCRNGTRTWTRSEAEIVRAVTMQADRWGRDVARIGWELHVPGLTLVLDGRDADFSNDYPAICGRASNLGLRPDWVQLDATATAAAQAEAIAEFLERFSTRADVRQFMARVTDERDPRFDHPYGRKHEVLAGLAVMEQDPAADDLIERVAQRRRSDDPFDRPTHLRNAVRATQQP